MSRSESTSARAEQEPVAPTIEQRPEYDKHGRYTGEDYWICAQCGVDAMARDVVAARCRCGGR